MTLSWSFLREESDDDDDDDDDGSATLLVGVRENICRVKEREFVVVVCGRLPQGFLYAKRYAPKKGGGEEGKEEEEEVLSLYLCLCVFPGDVVRNRSRALVSLYPVLYARIFFSPKLSV
jgi:hypothetical protein